MSRPLRVESDQRVSKSSERGKGGGGAPGLSVLAAPGAERLDPIALAFLRPLVSVLRRRDDDGGASTYLAAAFPTSRVAVQAVDVRVKPSVRRALLLFLMDRDRLGDLHDQVFHLRVREVILQRRVDGFALSALHAGLAGGGKGGTRSEAAGGESIRGRACPGSVTGCAVLRDSLCTPLFSFDDDCAGSMKVPNANEHAES